MWKKGTDPGGYIGGGRVGTLTAAPADVVRLFGEATDGASGDSKVDREWVFTHPEHGELRVYAYKATSLYDHDLPSPYVFWQQTEPYDLSIGGHSREAAAHFVEFFKQQLEANPAGEAEAVNVVTEFERDSLVGWMLIHALVGAGAAPEKVPDKLSAHIVYTDIEGAEQRLPMAPVLQEMERQWDEQVAKAAANRLERIVGDEIHDAVLRIKNQLYNPEAYDE